MCVWSVIWLYTPKQGVVQSFSDTPDSTFHDLRIDGPLGFHWWKPYSGFGMKAICRTDEESIRSWVLKHGGSVQAIDFEGFQFPFDTWLPQDVLDEFGYVPATTSIGDLSFNVDFDGLWFAGGYFDMETGQAFLSVGAD